MSNILAVAAPQGSPPADLARMDVPGLRAELARSLGMTAAHLVRLAWIVRLLEERGEDLSDLRIGLLDYLRKIAHGQVLPELVVRFGESPNLLRTLASLPMPDQRKVAAGEPVELIVRVHGGGYDRRLADPLKLTRDQVAQVFGRGKVRDEAEQILVLEDRKSPRKVEKARASKAGVVPDPRRGGLVVGRKFVAAGDIISALASLAGEPDAAPAEIGVVAKLTEAEHVALKNAATRSGVSMNLLIRRALLVSGLLSGE